MNYLPNPTFEYTPPQVESLPDDSLPPFPLEALPPAFRGLVLEACRLSDVEADLAAPVALAAVSAALGKGLRVASWAGGSFPPNIYTVIAAPSGSGKTRTLKSIFKPLVDEQTRRQAQHAESILPRLKAEERLLKAEAAKLEKGGDLERLAEIERRLAEIEKERQPPRLLVEDTTAQALAVMLAAQGESLCLASAESGDVLANLFGRHLKDAGATDEHLLLKSFSLEACTQDRISRAPVTLREPCLALVLLCQPDQLQTLFANRRFAAGGLLARCLIVESQSAPPIFDGQARHPEVGIWTAWETLLLGLLESFRDRDPLAPPALVRLTPEARTVLADYASRYGQAFRAGQCGDDCFAARHGEHAARLGLVMHAANHGRAADVHPLEAATARAACELVNWFDSHRRAQGQAVASLEGPSRAEQLARHLEDLGGHTTERNLKRGAWMDGLEVARANPDRFRVERRTPAAGGRTSITVSLIP